MTTNKPVAWVTADTVDGQTVNGKPRRVWWENNEGVGIPIYAAQQPSFQLPDFATDPDDSDEVASLWDHGFKRGWNSCLEAVTEAMQPAEQQPAPDVSGMVGASYRLSDGDEQALLEQQARELQALRDWREQVRRSFAVVDESVKMLPRDSYVAVDGGSLSRLGILIEFGVK